MSETKSALSLKTILVSTKSVEAEFPGFEGFKVKLAYLSREVLMDMRKKSTKVSFKGRQTVEEINDDLFLQLYVNSAIKGWTGLKLQYLEQLAPVDLGDEDLDAELEFSQENALMLMKNSTNFDAWISETVTDLGKFQKSSLKK